MTTVPKLFEKKMRECPSLVPTSTESKLLRPLRYKERESPSAHINEVSKAIGDQGRLQSLVETFIGQATRWWDTHQSCLQNWTTASTYFVERFGGKQLAAEATIPKFIQGVDPEAHVIQCENECKRLGLKDERAWPHMFPHTLDDLPSKWFKLKEAGGETLDWKDIRHNFILDFQFQSANEHITEIVDEIKGFITQQKDASCTASIVYLSVPLVRRYALH